jgi:hypothetical protein
MSFRSTIALTGTLNLRLNAQRVSPFLTTYLISWGPASVVVGEGEGAGASVTVPVSGVVPRIEAAEALPLVSGRAISSGGRLCSLTTMGDALSLVFT